MTDTPPTTYPAILWIWTTGNENLFTLNQFALANFKDLASLAAADSPLGPLPRQAVKAPARVNPTVRVDAAGEVSQEDEYDGPGSAKWDGFRKPQERKREFNRSGNNQYRNRKG